MVQKKNIEASLDPDKLNSEEYIRRGKEYLMTNFFIIIVFELIGKPLGLIFLNHPITKGFGQMIGNYNQYLLSTVPNGNENLALILISLALTGIYCVLLFRVSRALFYIPGIREYFEDDNRKEFYNDGFGAIILLSFLITGAVLMIGYPAFGIFTIVATIIVIQSEKKSSR